MAINFKHLRYFEAIAREGGVVRAAEKLHLTPQTLSGQVSSFEKRLGVELFQRNGRKIELTDTGRLALKYAEEIFQLGAELESTLRNGPVEHVLPFRVGVADVVPKSVAHRLLAPVLGQGLRLLCHEDRLEKLVRKLSGHQLDIALADRPMPRGSDVKAYSHLLGESAISFVATRRLAKRLKGEFPENLSGAPLLMPGKDSALHQAIPRWLARQGVRPEIVAEFDDSALMKAFGEAGAGVFPVSSASLGDVTRRFSVVLVGETTELSERFFLLSPERRVVHPAARLVIELARDGIFKRPAAGGKRSAKGD